MNEQNKSTNLELRSYSSALEVKGNTLSGITIPYNSLSNDLGGFREQFAPGSVSEAIRSGNIFAVAYHDMAKPLGDLTSGTLRLRDADDGLHYELDLPNTSDANDIKALAQHSANGSTPVLRGMSFAFRVTPDDQKWTRSGSDNLRTIMKAELHHVSPVIDPAYQQTSAKLRSMNSSGEDFMELYGIDIEKLQKIFLARHKGLEIDPVEMQIANEAISLLRSAICHPKLEAAIQQAAKVLL